MRSQRRTYLCHADICVIFTRSASTHNLKLSSSDLIRIVCPACGVADECPSVLCEEYDSRHPDEARAGSEVPVEKASVKAHMYGSSIFSQSAYFTGRWWREIFQISAGKISS